MNALADDHFEVKADLEVHLLPPLPAYSEGNAYPSAPTIERRQSLGDEAHNADTSAATAELWQSWDTELDSSTGVWNFGARQRDESKDDDASSTTADDGFSSTDSDSPMSSPQDSRSISPNDGVMASAMSGFNWEDEDEENQLGASITGIEAPLSPMAAWAKTPTEASMRSLLGGRSPSPLVFGRVPQEPDALPTFGTAPMRARSGPASGGLSPLSIRGSQGESTAS